MASTSRAGNKLTLFTLPPEIRNQIFILAVVDEYPLLATTRSRGLHSYAYPLPPGLARVCQQARKEIIPFFYGANTFHFSNPAASLKWHDELSNHIKGAAKHVTKITIDACYRFTPQRFHPSAHWDIDITLALYGKRSIKIYYSGLWKDVCTCELEAAARKMITEAPFIYSNALFIFAATLGQGELAITDDESVGKHYHGRKKRTESCRCGKGGRGEP